MGSLSKSVKMAASWLSLTIFVLFHQKILAQNPCQDMTVADCTLRPDNIIGTFPFPVADICQSSCVTADTCMFWRFFKNDTVTECLHLSTNYHQDCITFAGPTLGDIVACTEVDLATCSAYIGEECEYSGDRLEDFEPQPGQPARRGRCPLRDMEFTILSLTASLRSVCSTPPSRLTAASLEDQETPLPLQNVRNLLLYAFTVLLGVNRV